MLDYMLAGGLAWLIAFLIGPFTINMLRRLKAGQTIQKELPAEFQAKAGIPQMGGIIMLVAVTISGLLVTNDKTLIMWLLFLTLGNGLVGLIDDFIIMAMRRSVGLKARHKLLAQFLLALVFALYAYSSQDIGSAIIVPWGTGVLDLGPWFVPLVSVFVIVGMANGVNLADGMDGLAAGTTGIAAIALAVISHMALHTDVATFASALAGACLGFSWFNSHPAQVIMGDTGSLALGAGLAGIAVLTKSEFFLIPIGGIFIAQILTDIIQVSVYKRTKRRVFRMAPLHYHFHLGGMKETKVVFRFWSVGIILAAVGIWLFSISKLHN